MTLFCYYYVSPTRCNKSIINIRKIQTNTATSLTTLLLLGKRRDRLRWKRQITSFLKTLLAKFQKKTYNFGYMKIEEAILYCLARKNRGMRTEQIAEMINRKRLHVRKDGQPVTSN